MMPAWHGNTFLSPLRRLGIAKVSAVNRLFHPTLEMHDRVFRIHPAAWINDQRSGTVSARAKTALNGFDQTDVFFHRRFAVLHGQLPNFRILCAANGIPTPPDNYMIGVDRSPMIGVQHISGINLKRKHRP